MSTNYANHFSTRETPQTEPIPGTNQQQNNAGGYSFVIDDWQRLDRWLVLGSEGTYYVSEKKLTVDNAKCVQRCLDANPQRTVARIVQISEEGRAPKNDAAIFALAMAAAHPTGKLWANLDALYRICRIPTHLFDFCTAVQGFRGWGRSLRNMVANWYLVKGAEPSQLAYQMVKYQNRNGWTHRDVLRLSHPKADGVVQEILKWAVKGRNDAELLPIHSDPALQIMWAFEAAKIATDKKEVCRLIRDHNLPRECIPTKFLTEPEVWDALLEKMPMTAMIRNLATMTRVGLLTPMSQAVVKIMAELTDVERLKKARIHPIAVLVALKTYAQGHGDKGKNTWTPVAQVVDAIDGAFYKTFANVEPTGKRWMLALDVSGSMQGSMIAGCPGLSANVASAAMALVTAATEPQHVITAFQRTLKPLAISPRQRLDDACRLAQVWEGGSTDCAQPMLYALANGLKVDVFVVYTDSETWAGSVHPRQALQRYREQTGIPAKLIVVGMTATESTINDPQDAGGLDVVGFDSATPAVMSQFVGG